MKGDISIPEYEVPFSSERFKKYEPKMKRKKNYLG
jgi:hypothetical protein